MKIDNHVAAWGAFEPGKLVLIPDGQNYVYAFSVLWERDEACFLILEGSRAGDTEGAGLSGVLEHTGDVQLRLSKDSADWQHSGVPRSALVIGTDGKDSYFLFRLAGQLFAANVVTGRAGRTPYMLRTVSSWGVFKEGEDKPFIVSPPARPEA
jgi:hypothetical protein